MDKVFFPLDEELALLPGKLAPRQQEHLVHLACFMPFDKAAQMIEELLGVQTNEETVRQLTERVGNWMQAAQTAEIETDGKPESEEKLPLHRCAFSADGAMISLVKKQWVETRTVAIGEPLEKLTADGEVEIHVGHLSYFSRLADASTFTDLAEVEMRRRKVREAKEVCAVMDGADWLQFFTDRHRPDAVRILDFPHAAEHVTNLLEALEQAGMHFPPQMLDRCLHLLKHRGPRPLLHMADRLESDLAQRKGIQEHLDSLRKREALMHYPVFRQQGWPIGSGMVESANKNVVEARLKGPGMHWERGNVNPMLALRNAVCNDRWREMWQKALGHHRKLRALQRSAKAEQRARSLLAVGPVTSQELFPVPQPASQEISPPVPVATPPNSSRPSRRYNRHPQCKRASASHQRSGEVRTEVCLCGTALVRFKGHRTKAYCSDRCRMRAYRKRQRHVQPLSAPVPPLAPAKPQRIGRAKQETKRMSVSSLKSGGVRGETCLFCGVRLSQAPGGRMREFCSGRCRQRAYRERQRRVS